MNPAIFDRSSETSICERPYIDPFTTRCLRQSCSLLVESVNSRQYRNNNVSTAAEPRKTIQRHYRAPSTTYPKDNSTATAAENASTLLSDRLAPLSEESNAYREERNDSGVAMDAHGQKATNDPASASGPLAADENMHWDAFSARESKDMSKPVAESSLSTTFGHNPAIKSSSPLPLSDPQSQDVPKRNTALYSSTHYASSLSQHRTSHQPLDHPHQHPISSWSSRSYSPGHELSSKATKRPTLASITKRWAARFSKKMHLKS